MRFDWKKLSSLDRAIAGGALAAFIAGFLPWWGVSNGVLDLSVSGWSAGFSAWAGTLLLTAAGVLLVLRRSGVTISSGNVGPALLIGCVSALGLLLVVARWVTLPEYRGIGVGTRYGIYLALIAGITEVGASIMEMRASGETTVWLRRPRDVEQRQANQTTEAQAAPGD
jgi:hypothetical protein